ncbi:integral membrane sensor signal transduction histidine kinase [Cellulomonas flavigena DSM 20109]|uniref:histidine kinase n=1 Tax=Cellulomonas flavigena (strain ATCC 482 / DSM 20109 / BCRC 11376 / JCM 18109 / NBRC 3775 / NCIMB 8073 / NRS 134) TaxID=446466 RepID=D5UIR2_CELFN|nr:histidine kinase [Cellulomonas flavigena]ADG73561.1 integral membrane sensor signal transduction histidine kinase [Cellulomonas flavigena DSM 20109]
MTTATADTPAPTPATVAWLADRWRRLDHPALLTWVVAASLTIAVAAFLAVTPLWLPETVWYRRYSDTYPASHAPDPQRWFGLVATCAGLLGVAAVAVAPRLPWLAWLAATVPFVLLPVYGTALASSWLALASVAVVVATRRPRVAILPWTTAVALVLGWHVGGHDLLFPHGPGGPSSGTSGLLAGLGIAAYTTGAVAFAALLGHVLRTSAARTRDAESVAHDAVATTASVTERARLARELHDVVAHHVSLVAVRAESAPYSVPDLDPRAAATFAHIAEDARTALVELRHVLAVLRRDDDVPLAPLPTADPDALVSTAREAGQEVTVEGTWPRTDAGVGHVLHRAVQEGLSNARRHAPGARVHVRIADGPGVVGFRMTNGAGDATDVRPAHGLTGMSERVEALGGTVSAQVEDGTFVLVVSLPVDEP